MRVMDSAPGKSIARVVAIAFAACAICGCASTKHQQDPDEVATADFYWPYAVMAAHVYRTKGIIRTPIALAATSSYLNEEIRNAEDGGIASKRIQEMVKDENDRVVEFVSENDCATEDCYGGVVRAENRAAYAGPPLLHPEKCNYNSSDSDEIPYVPLTEVLALGWRPVPELQRRLYPEGWRIFVPGLVIDVWRRALPPVNGHPAVGYAVVYRGTDDNGGWISNFRTILAFTPFVWDQYRQAERATRDLVRQIRELHAVSDRLFSRKANHTEITVTAVGHSPGGGMATYVFLRVPAVTSVVGFDASPINGSFSTSKSQLHTREASRGVREASINLLYESGSILEKVSNCTPGSIRSDSGPDVICDQSNFSHGGRFDQHNIAQMTCKLYLVSRKVMHLDGALIGGVRETPREAGAN